MNIRESKLKRRAIVAINFISLIATIILAVLGELSGWNIPIIVGFWLSIAVTLSTFFMVHIGTGLWSLVHAKAERLDEREMQSALGSLRYAYGIFAIIALITLLSAVLFGLGSQALRLVIFWALLYLAHTLPSAVLAWKEHRI